MGSGEKVVVLMVSQSLFMMSVIQGGRSVIGGTQPVGFCSRANLSLWAVVSCGRGSSWWKNVATLSLLW